MNPLEVLDSINEWLAEVGCERRVYFWDTGGDTLAFLARRPDEIATMKAEGWVGDELSDQVSPKAFGKHSESDWSDLN